MVQGLEPAKWQYDMDETTYDIFDLNWRNYIHNIMSPRGGQNPEALEDYNWWTYATATNDVFTLTSNEAPTYINYFGIIPFGDNKASFTVQAAVSASNTQANWMDNPIPLDAEWSAITYGKGKYVSIAYGTPYVAVADAVTLEWQIIDTTLSDNWTLIKWTGLFFIALTPYSSLGLKSYDGISWTLEPVIQGFNWTDIITNEAGTIIITASGTDSYAYSLNYGESWAINTLPSIDNWVAGASNGSQFIIIASESSKALFSYDAINWNETNLPSEARWSSVAWGDNGYIAIADNVNNEISISRDGQLWLPSSVPVKAGWIDIAYHNQVYMMIAPDTNIALYSYDGELWELSYLPAGDNWVGITGGEGGFVACAHGFKTAAIGTDKLTKWATLSTYEDYDFIDGKALWVDLQNSYLTNLVRIRFSNTYKDVQLRGFFVGNLQRAFEIVCAKMNRDDFFAFPNKGLLGSPINYYFYKGTVPQIQLWQSATEANCFRWALSLYKLETPSLELNMPLPLADTPAWYIDGIIWLLASKLAFEIPEVTPERINMLQGMADKFVNQMEASNSDSSPISLIGAALGQYNR